jgi:glycosyltransferase involved in cell wall biosynthesis
LELQKRQMKISVVIPIFNAEDTLERCLNSLIEQNYKPYEIILIDNNSSDNSYAIAEHYMKKNQQTKIILTKEVKKGPSAVRNKGINLAHGDIIAFTDSDCIAHSNWLKNIVKEYKNKNIAAVAGNIKGFNPEGSIQKFLSLFTLRGYAEKGEYKEFNLISGGFPTANFSAKLTVLRELRGFDEKMKIYTEDFDLCTRLYSLGYFIVYTPDALVYHIHRKSIKGLITQSFGFGWGHAILLKKHFKRMFIIEFPKYTFTFRKSPFNLWINLVTADKKILFLIILGIIYWPLLLLLLFYLVYLERDINKRCKKDGISAGLIARVIMLFLLFIKSAALTAGRIFGSFKHKVICI